ncbi:MAG: hypothetical protein OXU23_01385, partial [Candidatus Poribacteria bacterium]|nr:hypothetical protein [Candidatus Poribacteria bacterium]
LLGNAFSNVTITLINVSINNTSIDADINDDGDVDLEDVKLIRIGMGKDTKFDTDVNDDGVTDEFDLKIVKRKAMEAIAAAAPFLIRRKKITTWGALKRKF